MFNQPLSAVETRALQLLMTVAVAVFIGMRFLPARYQQSIGWTLTIVYLLSTAAFVLYVLLR
jgi:hypothetical protein